MGNNLPGQPLPSGAVLFTGEPLTFTSILDALTCDASINDVFQRIDSAVTILQTQTDLTSLDAGCLDFDPETATSAQVHQAEINQICANTSALDSLTELIEGLDIGEELVNIDLGCLTPDAAPCAVGVNTYKLINILTLFKNEICALKNP